MTSIEVIEKIKLAVDLGLVNPKLPMFSDAYDNVWSSMIGPNWREDVLLAIYEMTERKIEFIDIFGTYHLN